MKKQLSFIFITVLIDVIGLGIIIPVLPELICKLAHVDLSTASSLSGWMASAFSIMMFCCAPILGGLSDHFGRRPILLFSLFGFGLDYILQGFAPNIYWLFVGRIIAGITGSSFSTAGAYISDISKPEEKAQNFGLIGAAFGLGFIIGPGLGALLGNLGPRFPFFGAAFLAFANFLFGYFILPESLKDENKRAFDWKRANPFGTFRILFQYPILTGFIATLFLSYIAHYSLQSTWSFYVINKFNWDHKMIGLSLMAVGLMAAIVQGGLSRIIIPKIGNVNSIYVGLISAMLGYLAYAFCPSGWIMFLIIIPFAFSGLAGPAIQGLIANEIPKNAQGELQGGMSSLMSFTAIIGPLLMTSLFHACTKPDAVFKFPGISFLAAFFLSLIALILVLKPLQRIKSLN